MHWNTDCETDSRGFCFAMSKKEKGLPEAAAAATAAAVAAAAAVVGELASRVGVSSKSSKQ